MKRKKSSLATVIILVAGLLLSPRFFKRPETAPVSLGCFEIISIDEERRHAHLAFRIPDNTDPAAFYTGDLGMAIVFLAKNLFEHEHQVEVTDFGIIDAKYLEGGAFIDMWMEWKKREVL